MATNNAILSVTAREILDSRGIPTLEVEVTTRHGTFRAGVPSGASTGSLEAVELRDQERTRFGGKGVGVAIENVKRIIGPAVIGMDCTQQGQIDRAMIELDGTDNKKKLGANAILGVSMAVCRAGAAANQRELFRHIGDLAKVKKTMMPVPSFNVLNGGKHAGNSLAMQEFMILPVGADSFAHALQIGSEVYHCLKGIIAEKYGLSGTNIGDEGGFAPDIKDGDEALSFIVAAINQTGYEARVKIGIDAAASSFWNHELKQYNLGFKEAENNGSQQMDAAKLQLIYESYLKKYPICFLEDPFDEEDWEGFQRISAELGDFQIIGDDILVTNKKRIAKALSLHACNSLLLKLNQIGTVTETIEACLMAQKAGWKVMVSHRSGETEDSFIADLAVGLCTSQIKSGAPCRGERLAKYNQLVRIEESLTKELGHIPDYAGKILKFPEIEK